MSPFAAEIGESGSNLFVGEHLEAGHFQINRMLADFDWTMQPIEHDADHAVLRPEQPFAVHERGAVPAIPKPEG